MIETVQIRQRTPKGTYSTTETVDALVKNTSAIGVPQQPNNRKAGRPSVDKERLRSLLASQKQRGKPSTWGIKRIMGIDDRTIRKYRKIFEDQGLLEVKTDIKKLMMDRSSVDFDTEAKEVIGMSFAEWLKSIRKSWKMVFNFCEKIWDEDWGRPSLYEMADVHSPVADQKALEFKNKYQADPKTVRDKKVKIRRLFTFLRRDDVNERLLKLDASRDLRPTRNLAEATLPDFPQKIDHAINLMEGKLGKEGKLAIRLKLVTLMRTGGWEKELFGIRCKEQSSTYLIMRDEDTFTSDVLAKKNESWNVQWIPKEVRHDLYELYQSREKGAKLFQMNVRDVRKAWKESAEESGIDQKLILHDLRKIALTWLYVMGLPLEYATRLNVGWKDLNTARDHYLQFRQALRKDAKLAYRANIPGWFKEGLDQYIEEVNN